VDRSSKVFRIVLRILAYVGIVLIGLGAFVLLRTLAIVALGERTDGIVIENVWNNNAEESTAQAIVRFQAGGRYVKFTSPVGMKPPLHHVNDKVAVIYWPRDPENAVIDGFAELFLRPLVLGGIGFVLLAIGGGFLWGPAWFARKRGRIIEQGVPVQAKVVGIRRDNSVEINDQSPWVINAEFKDDITGQTISCTSHYLWDDPVCRYPVGSRVTVYYLPDQPQKNAFQIDQRQGD
jgi:hypothetical protein